MIIAGLDPGLHGALVVVQDSPWRVLQVASWDVRKSSGNRRKAVAVINERMLDLRPVPEVAVVEAVGARPNQGSSSTFGFGLAAGAAEAVLAARGCRIVKVAPSKWKRQLGLGQDKHKSMAFARIWYPDFPKWRITKDHNVAEALLLAVWYAMQEAHRTIRPKEAGKWGILQ